MIRSDAIAEDVAERLEWPNFHPILHPIVKATLEVLVEKGYIDFHTCKGCGDPLANADELYHESCE